MTTDDRGQLLETHEPNIELAGLSSSGTQFFPFFLYTEGIHKNNYILIQNIIISLSNILFKNQLVVRNISLRACQVPRSSKKYKQKQGDLDDAREITAVCTFRDNQVEQLFKILKRICKGR